MAERVVPPEPADLNAAPDGELALRARGGSEMAARELVRRYERPVFNLIARLVRERPVAEELSQEAFLKVFRKLHTFDPQQRFSAWILRIAHNTALDYLRRRRPVLVPFAEGTGGEGPLPEEQVPDSGALPDRLLEQHRIEAAVEAALDRLRPEYREVIVLRYQEGLDYEEIARIVDRPLGTVKTFIHRARRALAAALVSPSS